MSKIIEPVVNVNDICRLSSGTSLKGEMKSESDIRVDGNVEGKVLSSGKIVVGENAVISGSVFCTTIDVWGTVKGDIYVKDVLSLKSSAKVGGNIFTNKFQVEMGASLNGSVHMISEQEFDQAAANAFKEGKSA